MPTVMQRIGTPNARHNIDINYRKYLENVDPALSCYNETIRHISIEDIYLTHLQPSFEEFNAKQKRKDRRLDVKYNCHTYLEYQRALDTSARTSQNHIDQKGRPPIREIIWQIGNPSQGYGCAEQTHSQRQQIKQLLIEVQREAELRYPQFVWGDLVFHADEVSLDANKQEHGSLHLHSSFVPICNQNKQGPSRQVAFERCLKEMGFDTFEAWKHDLDKLMEEVLLRHGLNRELAENHNKHQSSTAFHRQQKILLQSSTLEKEHQRLQKQVNEESKKTHQMIARKKELTSEIGILSASAKAGRGIVNSLVTKEQDLNLRISNATSELKNTRSKVLTARKTLSDIEDTISAKRIEVKSQENQLHTLQTDTQRVNQELHSSLEKLKQLRKQITDAENVLRRLKETLASIKGSAEMRLWLVQIWLDKTLRRISPAASEEFKRVFQAVREEYSISHQQSAPIIPKRRNIHER